MATSAQPTLDLEALYNTPLGPLLRDQYWNNAVALRQHLLRRMRRKYRELGEPTPDDSDLEARLNETLVSIDERQEYWGGSDHMTVDTGGKKFFPTPAVSTEQTITARLARRTKGSCSTTGSLGRVRRCHTRCCTFNHWVSSSSSNSSCGDANGVT